MDFIHWNSKLPLSLSYCLATAAVMVGIAYLLFIKVRHDYRELGHLTFLSTVLECAPFPVHGLCSYLFLDSRWSTLKTTQPSFIIGLILLLVGLVTLLLGSCRQLGCKKSFGYNQEGLIDTGLYSLTRNPQVILYGLALIGYAMWWPSWSGVVWFGVYAAIAHIMVNTEEEHLRRLLGVPYEEYCSRTPRYIGFPDFNGTNTAESTPLMTA